MLRGRAFAFCLFTIRSGLLLSVFSACISSSISLDHPESCLAADSKTSVQPSSSAQRCMSGDSRFSPRSKGSLSGLLSSSAPRRDQRSFPCPPGPCVMPVSSTPFSSSAPNSDPRLFRPSVPYIDLVSSIAFSFPAITSSLMPMVQARSSQSTSHSSSPLLLFLPEQFSGHSSVKLLILFS